MFDLVQAVHAPWLDVLGSLIGVLGNAEVTGGIALGLAVARWRRGGSDWWIPLAIAVTVLVESVAKLVIPQAPPPHERSRTVELLPFLTVPFAHSFPSGHVARVAFLLRIGHGIAPWLVVTGIVLMALSRIYLGEHWLSDTIGGAALGLLVAELARRFPAATRSG